MNPIVTITPQDIAVVRSRGRPVEVSPLLYDRDGERDCIALIMAGGTLHIEGLDPPSVGYVPPVGKGAYFPPSAYQPKTSAKPDEMLLKLMVNDCEKYIRREYCMTKVEYLMTNSFLHETSINYIKSITKAVWDFYQNEKKAAAL